MKSFTTTAIAALVAGTMGALVLAPAAFADDTPAAPAPQKGMHMQHPGMQRPGQPGGMQGMWMHRGEMGGPGNLLELACSERGGEALEIALVHVKYSVSPTAEQTPLFDTLHDAAIADQKTFADACKTANGDSATLAGKTIIDRLQAHFDIEKAKLTAMTDLLPKFKAFYDSLTDAQKAKLEPPHGGWSQGPGGHGRWADHLHRKQPGDGATQPPATDEGAQPAAPADDTAAPT